jgi:transporter family protein
MGKAAIFSALIFWGLWGVFPRLAIKHINQSSAAIWSGVASSIILVAYLAYKHFDFEYNFTGASFAALGGITGAIGGLFYLYAMQKENPINVVLITSMYPLISVLIFALFLNESLNLKQIVAMIFACIAIYLCNQQS